MDLIPERSVDEIRARLDGISPFPWDSYSDVLPGLWLVDARGEPLAEIHEDSNTEFIANAPADIEWLLVENARLAEYAETEQGLAFRARERNARMLDRIDPQKIAEIIDNTHEDDQYLPAYDDEGHIVSSASAEAVLSYLRSVLGAD